MKKVHLSPSILPNSDDKLFLYPLDPQKSYWLGRSVDEVKEPVTPPIQNTMFFEEDPKGIPAGVQVKGLTKVMRITRNMFIINVKNHCRFSS